MSSPANNGSATTGAIQPPAPLSTARQWVRWRVEQNRLGKPTKRPDCSVNDAAALRTFAAASRQPITSDTGVGFVFPAALPLSYLGGTVIGLDIDGCVAPDGTVAPWAIAVLRETRSYTEVSPSGNGLHVLVAALDLPPAARLRAKVRITSPPLPGVTKNAEVQMFGAGHGTTYLTFSGRHVTGTPTTIEARNLSGLWAALGMLRDEVSTEAPEVEGDAPSHDEIRAEVLRLGAGRALLDADWQALDKPSASEAYFALVGAVLRAARGHRAAALAFLLATAWGRGEVEESADPSRYQRREWVEKEIARAADKAPPLLPADEVFSPLGPLTPEEQSAAPTRSSSPIDAAWNERPPAGVLDDEPAPREFLLHRSTATGRAGFLPMAKVAVLASEGGVGKTNLLVQLAVSLVTGRPWLGFAPDPQRVGQHVLLLLAEEDDEEVVRRLWAASQQLGLTTEERALVVERVVALPLAGSSTPLVLVEPGSNEPRLTKHFAALERRLLSEGPWSLVGLDPMARLFPGAESANEAATYAVQAAERLCRAPGRPALIAAHHSSKMARRAGAVDVRGVTGLPDAARSNLMLRHLEGGGVELSFGKSNYGPRFDAVRLVRETGRGMGGLLRLAGEADLRAADDAATSAELGEIQALSTRIAEALQKHGPTSSMDVLRKLVGRRRVDCSAALAHAVENGLVRREQHGRTVRYTAKGPLDDLLT